MFGLSSLSSLLIAGAASLLIGMGSGGYIAWEMQAGTIATMKAADAKQEATNVTIAANTQKKLDTNALAAAQADAAKQAAIAATTRGQIEKVTVYVTKTQDAHNCVTWGLVRVYDSAALGADAASLAIPAGVTDDTCSPIVSSVLAQGIVRNFGQYHALAANHDALIALDTQNDAALQAQPHKAPSFFERINPFGG